MLIQKIKQKIILNILFIQTLYTFIPCVQSYSNYTNLRNTSNTSKKLSNNLNDPNEKLNNDSFTDESYIENKINVLRNIFDIKNSTTNNYNKDNRINNKHTLKTNPQKNSKKISKTSSVGRRYYISENKYSRYFKDQLTEFQKKVYEAIDDEIASTETTGVVEDIFLDNLFDYSLPYLALRNGVVRAYTAYKEENPDCWWISGISWDINYGPDSDFVQDITLRLSIPSDYTTSDLDAISQEIMLSAKQIAADIEAKASSAYEKLKSIHDYFIKKLTYVNQELDNENVYGSILEDEAQCRGYSQAFSLIAQILNLDVIKVSGYTSEVFDNEKHGWNYAQINHQWYVIDVTYDDLNQTSTSSIAYNYFLIGSNTIVNPSLEFTYAEKRDIDKHFYYSFIDPFDFPELSETAYTEGLPTVESGGACGTGYGLCPESECCSKDGICGVTKDNCGKGCKREFGLCQSSIQTSNIMTMTTNKITMSTVISPIVTPTTTIVTTSSEIPLETPTLTTSTNGRCGPEDGICPDNECCSQYNYCGDSSEHCDLDSGCQSEFGRCNSNALPTTTTIIINPTTVTSTTTPTPTIVISTNGRCGPDNGFCSDNECCSQYNYCGNSSEHCDINSGCQSEFGRCNPSSTSSNAETTTPSQAAAATSIIISTNGRCGPDNGFCSDNECCSKYNYCGNSSKHCDVNSGCQSEFGRCNPQSSNEEPTTTFDQATTSTATTKKKIPTSTVADRCGSIYGACAGSDECCSQYNYCGTSKDYCGQGCQPEYGLCF